MVQANPPRHGPKARYLGEEVPAEDLIWQDPVPAATSEPINVEDAATLKLKSWLPD
ncbi:catalase [Vibrio variabilis]|uniref:Catalase n=1 Tax=Vibrio variabilis TaxID=990271 RepID=A0ABQ0JRV3_9VIBR|nr:catalase [Vibrio variabilis]